jgi:hypothetical protein
VSKPRPTDPLALLDALSNAGVEYIVIGGAAAVLHGAPVTTQDLDIVHHLTPENVARLERVLRALHAVIREPGRRRLEPDTALLLSGGQVRLITDFGPLDVLGRLHDGRGYEELLDRTEELRDAEHQVRVVDLPMLIEIKGGTGRRRDQLVLPILEELLARRRS